MLADKGVCSRGTDLVRGSQRRLPGGGIISVGTQRKSNTYRGNQDRGGWNCILVRRDSICKVSEQKEYEL